MGRNVLYPVLVWSLLCLAACYESTSGSRDASRDVPSSEPAPADVPEAVPDPLPDPVLEPDIPNPCPAGWTFAGYGDTPWCISPYRGTGDCCEAWTDCQSMSTNTFPGIWPTAGPYPGVVPVDFFARMDLPGITIAFAGQPYPEGDIMANIACFDEEGIKQPGAGETHAIPSSLDCSDASCEEYQNTEDCPDDNIGCGCDLPYWCHMEIEH